MKFGLIKERKTPPDHRVVFSPEGLKRLKTTYPAVGIAVEASEVRAFSDQEYQDAGFQVVTNLNDCDVLFGVKEVPVDALIANKTYLFFSHTIKKQPYNQKLLRACLDKNITLIDHETLVDADNVRLIGFGRYAGMVGAYNALAAFGKKYDLYNLVPATKLHGKEDLIERLKRPFIPPIKIIVTGKGKVGNGVHEILKGMKMKEVSSDAFLNKTFTHPVFCQIDVLDYNIRKDGQKMGVTDFYNHPEDYVSDFEKFTKVADIFIAGHFYGNGAPAILTQAMLNAPDCKIKVVGDISCDVDGPIACTIRSSTIAEPLYGYNPSTGKEVPFDHPAAITVMAVDNLPCELPKEASDGFGTMFLDHVIESFFNDDKDGVLARAAITKNGKLTKRFAYLQDYADGK
ncbi:NAD(P)-dependent oxidoreductase [Flavobacterium agricola]|uniref:Saccharopine dehydrogenase [NAD(+), L-lysine-forming] n=1 Tax=Flavobacterium agricola TaxID=2870839 RepID=A0ABY6M383_9FLAO|nr:NAD(P)-dependent oxidoreductase [Flavobacterium agricola]UYW01813.1 NAD(P)-dependent oxidoreductase [Flavobacterium agricola]